MKYDPFNNNQGRIQPPPDLQHERLDAPDDLPELERDQVFGWAWIAGLVMLIALCLALLAGSAWIARQYLAHEKREAVAQAICLEKFGQYGQWRYASDSELWCSSAVTGDVRVVML